jgi:CTP-dependent riboflavin kinase
VVSDIPLPDGERLAEVARETAASGQVVYLTDQGRRLAAIVPAGLAELLEQRGEMTDGRRILRAVGAGRSGRHDISERMEDILRTEVTP